MNITPIAYIRTDFTSKFGIPRQSGRVAELHASIHFYDEYRIKEAVRGLDGYSHIWLLWEFSDNHHDRWTPTVRPPRLGGNKRVGVFATRSPYRPNNIGLSCVKLERIDLDCPDAPVLHVSGADLLDGTPIFDIKPYVVHADCRPDALSGFAADYVDYALEVDFPEELLAQIPESKRTAVKAVLAEDPRPSYQDDPTREYFMEFSGFEIGFMVDGAKLTVTVVKFTARRTEGE